MRSEVKAALGMYVFSYLIRVVDIFMLDSPAHPRSIIVSKAVPLLVLVYILVRVEGGGLGYAGFSRRRVPSNIFLGIILLFFTLGYNFVPDIVLHLSYRMPFREPTFYFNAGIAYYLFFCTVNGLMEEGVFRGYMQKKLYVLGAWNAIFVQSFLFGIWHVAWTFYNLYDFSSGWTVDARYVAMYTTTYVYFTFIFGIIMGYAYLKSGSIWGPVVCHTFYNFLLNFLLFNESGIGALIKYLGYPLMAGVCLLCVRFVSERMRLGEESRPTFQASP